MRQRRMKGITDGASPRTGRTNLITPLTIMTIIQPTRTMAVTITPLIPITDITLHTITDTAIVAGVMDTIMMAIITHGPIPGLAACIMDGNAHRAIAGLDPVSHRQAAPADLQ